MKAFYREEASSHPLHGRVIETMVGKNGLSQSAKMTMGYALYSAEHGAMEPHHHAEEICLILKCQDAWIRYGSNPDQLNEKIDLKPGMILHIPELEYHVFEYENEGFADIIFFYGQVNNLRPEDQK